MPRFNEQAQPEKTGVNNTVPVEKPVEKTDEELLAAEPVSLSNEEIERRLELEAKPSVEEETKPEVKTEVKPEEETKPSVLEELLQKKGWSKETGAEVLAKSYTELERQFQEASQDKATSKKELEGIQDKLKRLEELQQQVRLTPEQLDERKEKANTYLRQQLEEDPQGFIADMMAVVTKETERNFNEKYVKPRETEKVQELAEEQREAIISTLPGKDNNEKSVVYEKLKPELDGIMKEHPYLFDAPDGLLTAYSIYKGQQFGNIESEVNDKENKEKNAIDSGAGVGKKDVSTLITSEKIKKMTPQERAKITDADLEAGLREERANQ